MTNNIQAVRSRVGQCGYTDTQSGDPCTQPALFVDDRCWWHSDTDERKPGTRASDKVMTQFPVTTHRRLKAHQRDDETLAGVIERGLDALEGEV